MTTRVLRSMRHPVTQRTSSSPRERARDAVLRRRTQAMTERVSGRRIRGSQQDPHSRESHSAQEDVALWFRRESSQQDSLEQADRREAQLERASKLERGHRAVAQLQESRDTLFDGTPEQKSAKPASPGRVRQTRGAPGRERRPKDLSGRLITAAHASVDSWGETRTRLDYVLGYTNHQEHGSDWLTRPR